MKTRLSTLRVTLLGFSILASALLCTPANAQTLHATLTNFVATSSDYPGSTATGTFDYNATTLALSNIAITVTVPGVSGSPFLIGGGYSSIKSVANPPGPNFTLITLVTTSLPGQCGYNTITYNCVSIVLNTLPSSPGTYLVGTQCGSIIAPCNAPGFSNFMFPCPPGGGCTEATGGRFATGTLVVTGVNKSLGTGSVGQCYCGDPIDPSTGNVFEQVTDYDTTGPNILSFSRYYNSMANLSSTFAASLGSNWRTSFDRFLRINSSSSVTAERPDGRQLSFTLVSGVWTTDTDVDYVLTNSGTSWSLKDPQDSTETYTAASSGSEALLETIEKRNGYTQTLTYNSSNQLVSVVDSYSRSLSFTYSGALLQEMTTPEGNIFRYAYTSSNILSFTQSPIDYPGGATYGYHYVNTTFPTALTGITDRYGDYINNWTYDSSGRGITSSEGSSSVNANLTSIAYNADGSATVTNALGVSDTYTFSLLQNIQKVTGISRTATSTTAAATRAFSYDSNGFKATSTDWNGNRTSYVNNSHGLPTTIDEAVGTSVARTTTIAYDTTWVHLPDTITTPGVTIGYTYDGSGETLTKKLTDTTTQTIPYSTNGQTRTWTYTWSNYLPATVKTPNGNTTTYTFDSTGAMTKITNPLSQSISITAHTAGGYPQTIVDANGVSTAIVYDAQMRKTSNALTTTAGVLTTTWSYWTYTSIYNVTYPDGSGFTTNVDTALRPISLQDGDSSTIKTTLDELGDPTQINTYDSSNTLHRQHSGTFDALGRTLTDVGGAGQTTTYTRDSNGNPLTVKDGLSHTTTNTFDPLNRLSTSTDANGGVITMTYDPHDRPLTVKDKDGNTTSYIYDGPGDRIQETSPDSGTTVAHFDSDGNKTSRTDAASVVTNWTFDTIDRPLTTAYPADSTENVAYTWDQTGHGFGIGRLTSVTDASGSLSRTYDERGDILTEKRTNGSTVLNTTYTFDKAQRVSSITYPSGALVSYTRDNAGYVVNLPFSATHSDEAYVAINLEYLPFGPLHYWNPNNGDQSTLTYDLDYRLTNIAYNSYPGTTSFLNWTYAYDNANNVTSVTDNLTTTNSQTIGYDVINRMTSASSSGTYGAESWTFDKNSNMLTQSDPGASSTLSYPSTSNQLTGVTPGGSSTQAYTYTGTGNLVNIAVGTTNLYTFTYNKANRLSSVMGADVPLAITGMAYDYAGKRITKTESGSTPILYSYDLDGNLIEENNGGTVTDYIYVDGINIGNWEPSEQHLYMINVDARGVPQVSRDEYGLTNWAAYSSPHGVMTQTVSTGEFTGPVTQNLRLQGQYYDHEYGGAHNGFRDTIPGFGRFFEVDPIGLAGGINPYLYGNANPLKFADKSGLVTNNEFPVMQPQNFYANYYNPPGFYSFAAHGASDGSVLFDPQGNPMNAVDAAIMIGSDPDYQPGEPIVLLSCNAGAGTNSIAQSIANLLSTQVIATSDTEFSSVSTTSTSHLFDPDTFTSTYNFGAITPAGEVGTWNLYSPLSYPIPTDLPGPTTVSAPSAQPYGVNTQINFAPHQF